MGKSDAELTANWKLLHAIPKFTYTRSYQIVDDNIMLLAQHLITGKLFF